MRHSFFTAWRFFWLRIWAEVMLWPKSYFFRRPLFLVLALSCLGLIVADKTGLPNRLGRRDPANWTGLGCALTGVVADHPEWTANGSKYVLEAETFQSMDEEGRPIFSVQGKVLVHVSREKKTLPAPGDRLRIYGKLLPLPNARLPGTFDYGRFLRNHGIRSLVYTGASAVKNLGPSGFHWPLKRGWELKLKARNVFRSHLSEEAATVLCGLVLGERPRLHPDIRRIFLQSGTMHVLVASGSNVAFVIAIWIFLVRFCLRMPRRWVLAGALFPVTGYTLLVGADPPIVRAGLMAAVGIFSYLFQREDKAYHAWTLAALANLVWAPLTLFDVGFQMSFAAVFGLLYFLPWIDRVLETRSLWLRWGVRLLAATLAAQIWIFPISVNSFRQFFPVGIIANIFMVPLSGLGFTAGLLLIAADTLTQSFTILTPILSVTVTIAQYYLNAVILTARFFAEHPGVCWWMSPLHACQIAGYYTVCLSLPFLKRSDISRFMTALGVGLVLAGVWLHRNRGGAPETLTITWLDAGRDLMVLARPPNGSPLLIIQETLSSDIRERVLMPYLAYQGIKRWEEVAVSSFSTEGKTHRWDKLSVTRLPGSKSFVTAPVLLLQHNDSRVLLAKQLSLETQRVLVECDRKLDVIQMLFSDRQKWDEKFIRKFQPAELVEVGYDSQTRPSQPPWPKPTVRVIQKMGWHSWCEP